MKKKIWLISAVAALTAAAALAQESAPAASQSAAKPQKARTASVKKRVEMEPPAAAIVKGNSVNVRGQPSFVGEVLGHLQNGATVTVLEQITLNHPPSGEPAEWYKIAMPPNIPVWVKGDFIDAATKSVKARRVNLRGGPGENYSVVGRLEKGAMINQVRDENGWTAIEAPSNAYAFVAAGLLEIQAAPAAAPVAAAAPAPEPVAVPAPVAPPPAAATPAPEPAPATPVAPAPTAQTESEQELAALRQAVATEPAPSAAAPAPAPAPVPSPEPRIVTREGFVHKAYNIQSPADYELHDIKTGELIEYLQPEGQPNFKMYVGTRITVTGPEVIDQRWPRTPILRVQSVNLMP